MSEWQPARIRVVHDWSIVPESERVTPEEVKDLLRKVVRIRPATDHRMILLSDFPCYSPEIKMYQIHPEDCVGDCFICEHEILTD